MGKMRNEIEFKNTDITALEMKIRQRGVSKTEPRKSKVVFVVLATFGIFGGISALFVGLVLAIIHSALSGDTIFDQMGTGLLIAGIPMILIGSIFLDKIEGKDV
jgi:hypothetical protein